MLSGAERGVRGSWQQYFRKIGRDDRIPNQRNIKFTEALEAAEIGCFRVICQALHDE